MQVHGGVSRGGCIEMWAANTFVYACYYNLIFIGSPTDYMAVFIAMPLDLFVNKQIKIRILWKSSSFLYSPAWWSGTLLCKTALSANFKSHSQTVPLNVWSVLPRAQSAKTLPSHAKAVPKALGSHRRCSSVSHARKAYWSVRALTWYANLITTSIMPNAPKYARCLTVSGANPSLPQHASSATMISCWAATARTAKSMRQQQIYGRKMTQQIMKPRIKTTQTIMN